MHKQSIEDLEYIKDRLREIEKCKDAIERVKVACPHLDYKVDYIETFKFEYDPHRICVVCGETLDMPTKEEKLELRERRFDDSKNLSLDGFNLDIPYD